MIDDFYVNIYLKTKTTEKNDQGQPVRTYTITSTFKGIINKNSLNPDNQVFFGKQSVKELYKLYCGVDTNISFGDIVNDGTFDYKVIEDPKNCVKRNHHYRILLEKIKNIT